MFKRILVEGAIYLAGAFWLMHLGDEYVETRLKHERELFYEVRDENGVVVNASYKMN